MKNGLMIIFVTGMMMVVFSSVPLIRAPPEPVPHKSGPAPEGTFVFFDCNWVEIPDRSTSHSSIYKI